MKFDKLFKTIEEQIDLLNSRGLITDSDTAHYLKHLNYYRLAGYWLPFQNDTSNHLFNPNTHFSDVLNLYIFDRQFRLLLLDCIERIEVSFRTTWAYYCAKFHGAHAYLDSSIFKDLNRYTSNLNSLDDELQRSREEFVKHYFSKYSDPDKPPIWVICEVMSLGLLSRWFKTLRTTTVQNSISKEYGIDYNVLISFIEHVAHLRNLCAHHSRVWNRKFVKTMQLPKTKPKNIIQNFNYKASASRKIYNTLVLIIYLNDLISPQGHFRESLILLISKHKINTKDMGFPDNWQSLDIWKI